jgi:hypothetical protein
VDESKSIEWQQIKCGWLGFKGTRLPEANKKKENFKDVDSTLR